jgi:uncharacterized RDD family membrane protein YckC
MVFDDIPYDSSVQPSVDAQKAKSDAAPMGAAPSAFSESLASPLDRMAAVVADLIVFLPLLALAIAPFRRQALVAQLLSRDEEWNVALVGAVSAGLVAILAYQTFFVWIFGATLGKLVLGLRVQPVWGEKKPPLMAAFLRSFTWCAELAILGLPWLAVFADERRRPFHDRVADTAVVSVGKRKPAGPPSLAEKSLASGVYAALLGCITLVTAVSISQIFSPHGASDGHRSEPIGKIVSEMESKGLLCRAVGNAKQEWIAPEGATTPPRLAIALSLYGAEAIDETCLEQEADFSLWREKDRALAYVAKGLVQNEGDEARESYLEKACEVERESAACQLSRLIILQDEQEDGLSSPESAEEKLALVENQNEMDGLIEQARLSESPFLKVWSLKSLASRREYARAYDFASESAPERMIGQFYSRERTKALWSLDRRDEARLSARSAIDTFDKEQRGEFARWLCDQETKSGRCESASLWSCDVLAASIDKNEQWLGTPEVATAFIRGEACRNRDWPAWLAKIEPKLPDAEARSFVKALRALTAGREKEGVRGLKEIASDISHRSAFFFEANEKLVSIAKSAAELEPVIRTWAKLEPSEAWAHLGHELVARLGEVQDWSRSIEVGLKLLETDRFDREVQRKLVVAAYRAGNRSMAAGFLSALAQADQALNKQPSAESRRPASTDEFQVVAEELAKDLVSEASKEPGSPVGPAAGGAGGGK